MRCCTSSVGPSRGSERHSSIVVALNDTDVSQVGKSMNWTFMSVYISRCWRGTGKFITPRLHRITTSSLNADSPLRPTASYKPATIKFTFAIPLVTLVGFVSASPVPQGGTHGGAPWSSDICNSGPLVKAFIVDVNNPKIPRKWNVLFSQYYY